ncbi:MAG TPA: sterol desaturase family protein [Polyangiaceae bacterium]
MKTVRPAALFRLAASSTLFMLLASAERAKPLRRRVDRTGRRWIVNFAFALTGGAALALTHARAIGYVTAVADRHRFGLLRWVPLPRIVRGLIAIALLDYSLWAWHLLNHRLPILWRFHSAHHADLDLDVSTGVRFHFGELLLSVPYRALQVLILGVRLPELRAWETLTFAAILFHHSNVRLPPTIEDRLRRFIITPRLHGIHHSTIDREVSSNFGTILTLWDFLHRLHIWDIPQGRVVVGLSDVRRPLGAGDALALPFRKEAPRRADPSSSSSREHHARWEGGAFR